MRSWERSHAVPVVLAFLLCVGCMPKDTDPSDPPVARAWETFLYWSDLRQVVPMGSSPEDSAAIAQRYIGNWLREQAVLHAAELNMALAANDFEVQLRDYRNSLLKYAFEEAVVGQKLDTMVKRAEVEEYYERNRSNFELKDNILRVRWFKLREDDRRTLKRLEEHFLSGKPERMHELEMWLAQHGVAITDRSNTWITLNELRLEVPLKGDAPPEVPAAGKRMLLKQDGMTWFLEVLEQRMRDSVSPLDLVHQDIRSIIINQRKLQLIERMREDLHREAIERRDIELL